MPTNMRNGHAAQDRRSSQASFSSWKFDLINAICADRNLISTHKIVAICILGHVNETDPEKCFPSDQCIADETGIASTKTVRLARDALWEAGWLTWQGSLGKANTYRVLDGNVAAIQAEQAALRARRKPKKQPLTSVMDDRGQDATPRSSDATPRSSVSLTPVTGDLLTPNQHLKEHLKEESATLFDDQVDEVEQADGSGLAMEEAKPEVQQSAAPMPSQRQAAKLLGVPESTLRETHLRESRAKSARGSRTGSATGKADDIDAAFDLFWQLYPRRVGKIDAKKAFAAVLKRGDATADEVIAGAARFADEYRRMNQRDRVFTKHPATWLNKGCWTDEEQPRQRTVIDAFNDETERLEREIAESEGRVYIKQERNPFSIFDEPAPSHPLTIEGTAVEIMPPRKEITP